jgi:uncharacterized integral membrane protein
MSDTASTPETKKKPIYTRPKFIASIIAGVVFLILIFQNWEMTTIEIFFWTATLPRSVFYLIFALIGFVVGWLVKRPKSTGKTPKKP